MKSNAILSSDRKYRYVLERAWDESLPKAMFIGLNPSMANETKDDPTVKRLITFAKSLNYDGFYLLNLFAYRSTQPENLWKVKNPIGNTNDDYILEYSNLSDMVIACWGNKGTYKNRSKEVSDLLNQLHCFGKNKTGQPKHPLYLKRTASIVPYK